MAAAIEGLGTELVLGEFKCLDAIGRHLMIMEVREAIGETLCVHVHVNDTAKAVFLCFLARKTQC